MKESPNKKPCILTGEMTSPKWYKWPRDNPTGYITKKAYLREQHKLNKDERNKKRRDRYAVDEEYRLKTNIRNNSPDARRKANEARRLKYAANPKEEFKRRNRWKNENKERFLFYRKNVERELLSNYLKDYRSRYYRAHFDEIKAKRLLWKTTPEGKWHSLRLSAKRRNIPVYVDFGYFSRLITQECHYCNGPLDKTGGTIDRLDSDGPYAINNIVPCCSFCNYLKSDLLTEGEMKSALEALSSFRRTGETKSFNFPLYYPKAKRDRTNNRYTKLKHSALSRGIELVLTESEYLAFIVNKHCYYCTADLPTNGSGLDRIHHNIGYQLDNIIPCCPFCNDVRSDKLSVDETQAIISGVQEWRMKNPL